MAVVKPRVKVIVPKVDIETPRDKVFWRAVGIEVVGDIKERTLAGVDADKRSFTPYAQSTVKARAKKGLKTGIVDLSESSRMLNSMPRGVRASKDGVKMKITGDNGRKAWHIKFDQRRNFFSMNVKDVERIIKRIKDWMKRKNK